MSQKRRQERQARYSLYSTDSEGQVASAHRGLDRCAALLKSLLSPEKGSEAPPQHQPPTQQPPTQQPPTMRRRRRPAHSSHKITDVAGTAGKTKDSRAPQTTKLFPGASRLLPHPPSSSSEPTARHPPSSSSEPTAGHPQPPSSSSEPTARHPPSSSSEPTAGHPQPPSSSLVPTARHSRTKTDTKAMGKPPGTAGKSPREAPSNPANKDNMTTQSRVTEPGKLKSSRRLLVAHRRLKTEPDRNTTAGGDVRSTQLPNKNVLASLGNRHRSRTANVKFSATQQPQLQTTDSRSAARGLTPSDPNPCGTTSVPHTQSQAPPPSLGYHYPYAVPPLHFASPYGYYPPFWPYFHPSARFAPPISSQGPTLSQNLQPGFTHTTHPPATLHSASLPPLPAQSHTTSSHSLNSGSHHNIGCSNPEENQTRVEHSNKSTPWLGTITRDYDPSTPAGPSHGRSATKGASEAHTAAVPANAIRSADCRTGPWQGPTKNQEGLQTDSDPGVLPSRAAEAVQVLAQEMLCSVKDSIVRIRGVAGSTNTELFKSLQDLEDIQKSYHERLTALCLGQIQGVGGGRIPFLDPATNWVDRSDLPSAADWLAQLQQLESEKSHLLERVVQSEMAYSETKGLLDQAEKKAEQLRKELETQLLSVKSRLQTTSEALSTLRGEKVAVEEELEKVRTADAQLTRQLNAKTAALEWQVSSLEVQLSESKEELCRSGDQLSATRCSLETGKEEKQMVQLSLAEKETELLQAQDRLLGLRQCLAYFLSDVVKSDTPHHYQQHSPLALLHYRVPREAVQRLQSLVSEGNVERFLAAYDSLPRQSGGSPLASLYASPTPVDTSSPHLSKPGPTSKGMTSPVQLSAIGDDSQTCAHLDSDGSTIIAQGDASTESIGKGGAHVVQPGSNSSSRKGSPRLVRAVALSQRSGCEVERTQCPVVHTAASHMVSQEHTLKNSSPKSTASCRSGGDAANLTSTDLQSVLTTSSEVEFRRDLASLDANIARLQMQFRVAMQRQPTRHL